MADGLETATMRGEIKIVGKAHGALNTCVYLYGSEDQFEFKQFVDESQLHQFAMENNFSIKGLE